MSHKLVDAVVMVLVPLQTNPGPVLVISAYTVELAVLLEREPTNPCGNMRLTLVIPEPPRGLTYWTSGFAPALSPPERLMVFVPMNVRVPLFTKGTVGLRPVRPSPNVAPGAA